MPPVRQNARQVNTVRQGAAPRQPVQKITIVLRGQARPQPVHLKKQAQQVPHRQINVNKIRRET